jgi:hypothetical protein
MMKKLAFIIVALSSLVSCSKLGVQFNIENNTGKSIDSIVISNGYDVIKSTHINAGEVKNLFLDFKQKHTKSDGSYYLNYYMENTNHIKNFGYFSNGIPLSEKIEISIEKDTVYIKEDF